MPHPFLLLGGLHSSPTTLPSDPAHAHLRSIHPPNSGQYSARKWSRASLAESPRNKLAIQASRYPPPQCQAGPPYGGGGGAVTK